MATLTSSGVTVVRAWTEGGVTGKQRKCLLVRAVLDAAGGAVGDLPATAFGLTEIEEVSNLTGSADNAFWYPNVVYARTSFLLSDNIGGGIGGATGTFQFIVKGF